MGKVTSMRLLAAPDMPPPVAEVVKPTTYWVRAPAARDGFVLSTVTRVIGLAATTVNCAESTGCGSDVVETVVRLSADAVGGLVMPLKVIATLWPARDRARRRRASTGSTRPLGLPQLPTLVAVVRLRTVALT